jgi:hypothetical protein
MPRRTRRRETKLSKKLPSKVSLMLPDPEPNRRKPKSSTPLPAVREVYSNLRHSSSQLLPPIKKNPLDWKLRMLSLMKKRQPSTNSDLITRPPERSSKTLSSMKLPPD